MPELSAEGEAVSTQPEALRLADDLEAFAAHGGGAMDRLAAAELRRLHAVNAELLEACIYLVQGIEACGLTGVYLDQARAAIIKATEVKP